MTLEDILAGISIVVACITGAWQLWPSTDTDEDRRKKIAIVSFVIGVSCITCAVMFWPRQSTQDVVAIKDKLGGYNLSFGQCERIQIKGANLRCRLEVENVRTNHNSEPFKEPLKVEFGKSYTKFPYIQIYDSNGFAYPGLFLDKQVSEMKTLDSKKSVKIQIPVNKVQEKWAFFNYPIENSNIDSFSLKYLPFWYKTKDLYESQWEGKEKEGIKIESNQSS